MTGEQQKLGGFRLANPSPTRNKANASPTKPGSFRRSPSIDGPMLSASSSNNHSLFSFGGRNGGAGSKDLANTSTGPLEFLPSVSFDDLHSSLESASTEFKLTQFPSPTGQGSILGDQDNHDESLFSMADRSNITQRGGTTRVAIQQQQPPARTSRTASILRRPSTSGTRPTAVSSAAVFQGPGVPNAPTAPAAMRPRRQSHYPPVSNAHLPKAPRKSVGPGILDSEADAKAGQRRRPSLMSGGERASLDGGARVSSTFERSLTNSRASKARSVQPPPRASHSSLSAADNSTLSVDTTPTTSFPRSPRMSTQGKAPNTPGSNRRMSTMPGPHQSHLSGLGARTISPTDARRLQRMSTMHTSLPPPPVSNQPLPTTDVRPSSRSPSMIPRKTSTPSSSRTTPELGRKSYSSGLSVNSSMSYNTVRTSVGSFQPRGMPPNVSSRLPAPKALNLSNQPAAEDEEDVPPVPAIPKVYESPKEPVDHSFVDKQKAVLGFDTSSIHSNSTGSLSLHPSEPPKKMQRKSLNPAARSDTEKQSAVAKNKRSLQPLRLPPLNLGPLSTPTTAKIAALQEQRSSDRNLSPPAARQAAKTPTTPMTASKSSFFSRSKNGDKVEPIALQLRSTSSAHRLGHESHLVVDNTSSSESIPIKSTAQRSGMSPFPPSSAPKIEDVEPFEPKSFFAGGNFTLPTSGPAESAAAQKPSGPRDIGSRPTKSTAKATPPLPSPDEPPTPSSMTSLRRKLSLSWKRSASKNSMSHPHGDKADQNNARHDSMPPPRIPISATLGARQQKTTSPTPSKASGTGTYLESRRRKSSASSLNTATAQDRHHSDSLGGQRKDSNLGTVTERAAPSHSASVVQKILKPKASTNLIRQPEVYTAELDKDDRVAEEEMRKLGSRRKETELAARTLDALRKRATAKERVSPQEAIRIAVLNIYERGEIVDYKDVYFCGTQNAAKVVGDVQSELPNFGYDDERGDYSIVSGDHLAYRYEIIDVLGKGSFGQVVRCIDHKTGVLVAVKIIRNKKRFHQQALVEVNILQKLREWDPKNKHSMVNFTHSFYFRGHLCISTELLDMNLYEFIKSNQFRGFSVKLIRRFTKQLLSSLILLKQHKVIHCDLKPENILLRHPLHSEIKVIDFGSSCFEHEKVYTYIQSRFYRSPEVILGMTYGLHIDMWSLGCILAELYTGVPIFPGENEQEQLACIMEVFGPPEKHLIEKSTRKKLFFDSMGKPRLTVSSKGRRRRPSSKTLQQALKCDDEPFLDFLTKCLRWDPDRRLKPEEAIRHEFISGVKASGSLPRAPLRDASPTKRVSSTTGPRPLPEPPATLKPHAGIRSREVSGASNGSPLKSTGITSRRASGLNTTSTTGATVKRVSASTTGGSTSGVTGTSSLPRASIRSVSAKQDTATAGATAAMRRA